MAATLLPQHRFLVENDGAFLQARRCGSNLGTVQSRPYYIISFGAVGGPRGSEAYRHGQRRGAERLGSGRPW